MTEDLTAAVRGLLGRHLPTLRQQVADIEDAMAAAMAGDLDGEQSRQARRQAHKLAGSGGMFGLHRTSELARQVEEAFDDARPDDSSWIRPLAALVVELADSVEEVPDDLRTADDATAGGGDREAASGPRLVVWIADEALSAAVAGEAGRRGFHVVGPEGASAGPDRPAAALVGATVEHPSGDDLLDELAGGEDPVPTLVLVDRDEPIDRVGLVRRGARGFLTRPVEASRVLDAVAYVLETRRLEGTSVVAVDDDPAVLDVVQHLLADEGVTVHPVRDPRDALDVLERVDPDLVILDVEMPEVNGIELCRTIRADPRWLHLSILFLTVRDDTDTITRVFAAGADDYVTKPLNREELVVRIGNRLERIRLTRALVETDPVTGVASRARAHDVVERLQQWSDVHDEPMSVALLDLDDFKAVNDRCGHAMGDTILRDVGQRLLATFRGEDVVARWGGQEFIVAMHGLGRRDGVDRIARVLEEQREVRYGSDESCSVTFSGAVAQYGPDGANLHELYRAADGALRHVKQVGGNRVYAVGRQPPEGRDVLDVVIVEDDATLGPVVLDAVLTRGWTARWIERGDEAERLLGGDPPDLKARVVLLDWDLPGLDGPTVLRGLRQDRRTSPRVIMLTVHGREDEVVRTLRLGAFDHVTKPFSIPVLMQRVRLALAEGKGTS